MDRRSFLKSVSVLAASSFTGVACTSKNNSKHPNIIIIYADDLGYGDVSCYGAKRVKTPNIDSLAKDGLQFTEAYATAATCTPSRFSLLTGKYAWRKEGTGIAPGDASLLISTKSTTLPSMLGKAGYTSGVVGKWHLGLGDTKPDWNTAIKPGPLEIGFNYSFLIPATGDRVPCVFVENHHVVGLDPNDPITVSFEKNVGNSPTGTDHPEMLKFGADPQHSNTIINGISRIGYMTGGKSAHWVDEDIADIISHKATSFIEKNKNNPFFLYFSLHDIHVPRVPNPRFVGKSEMGPRGDAIVQADWCVGEILNKLNKLNLSENTLVVFTSDNGPVLNDGYSDQAEELKGNHKVAGPLRGGKYSSFEGGTRIPMLLRWPEKVKPGVSKALISQVDFIASFASLTGQTLNANEAMDSKNNIDALLGKDQTGRSHLVQQSAENFINLRKDQWKYIEPGRGPKLNKTKNIETGRDTVPQLYDLSIDVGEQVNVADKNPQILKDMETLLQKIRKTGDRSLRN